MARAVVAEVRGGQRVDGLEAPLTGRDREMRLLKELFHATEASGRPRLVVLDGEAGVGKSRMAWEFEKYADGLSAVTRWHRGRCLSYGDGVAFWPLAEAVRARLGLTEGDTGDIVADKLDAGLAEFVPNPEERDWPRLGALVRAGSTGDFMRPELFIAWTTWFERVGTDSSSVVLVVDDARHADDALLDFAEHVLANVQSGIFVLALARPELLARRPVLGGRRTSVIRLDPLDDEAMSRLVDGLVVGLSSQTRQVLVGRAEGVPLFAVETVRALIDRDAVVPRDGRYVLAEGAALDLDAVGAPASLQALVAARIDALSPEERRVVADASVLGAVFTRDGLLALGSEPATLDVCLESLQRREILAVQQDRFAADRGQFRFVQSVVRQVVYGTQSRRDRKTRHLDRPRPAELEERQLPGHVDRGRARAHDGVVDRRTVLEAGPTDLLLHDDKSAPPGTHHRSGPTRGSHRRERRSGARGDGRPQRQLREIRFPPRSPLACRFIGFPPRLPSTVSPWPFVNAIPE